MTKLIFILINIFFIRVSFCQQSLAEYKIKENGNTKTGTLFFDSSESHYISYSEKSTTSNSSSGNEVIDKAMLNVEKSDSQASSQKSILKRNLKQVNEGVTYVESLTPYKYSVIDKKGNQEWKITKEQKVINNFECIKAESDFRGRKYIAWYTPEIPTKAGPWKFAGLPGLIVSISSNDGLYQFELLKIENVRVKPSFTSYTLQNDVISFETYISKVDEFFQKRADKIYSETSKGFMIKFLGAKTSPVKMNMKNIEKEFEKIYESKAVDN